MIRPMGKKPTNLTLPARLENLERFQKFISTCAKSHSLSEDQIFKLQLASEEALVNIFAYAYSKDAPGNVSVSCTRNANKDFQIVFEDSGKPFDMLSVSDPDIGQSLTDRPVGGLGIFFIKKMTDSVHYKRKDGKNILTFCITAS